MKGVVLELIVVILDAFWHPFWIPGAISVVFLLNLLEVLRGAFWLPFGCLLGALWVPWGRLWETLGQLWQPWGSLWKGCPTMSHHIPAYITIFPPSD